MTPLLSNRQNGVELTWFAVVNFYEGMPQEVYGHIRHHVLEPLYLATSLESLMDRSPLVIALHDNDPIISSLPRENTIYFSAAKDVPLEQVLKHLRLRLEVQFSGERKGVFHYYIPSVASYFFRFSSQRDTSQWLGCLSSVYFYDQVISTSNEWGYIEGELEQKKRLSTWVLTQSQEIALNEKFVEQEIEEWANSEKIELIDWSKQKSVNVFCTQHQIEEPRLLSRLRRLVHIYGVSLEQNSFQIDTNQAPESIVEQIELVLSRESHYVY
ncbi:DUF4123 domain-containing protein [Vibrio hepatarius]|jgi:hypothetical protein|uniref:DUF4123 domain-containing protein n=1 Tax=Vibrio hepatarius TaxID=171383 RepID=A0A0M0HUG9_9VIBR|nr:DUF4123 domain-containing protein [Vibrio hepatarius]KOO05720.1 hypothetical protein AKJ31_20730 [Vibrio hepatarius]